MLESVCSRITGADVAVAIVDYGSGNLHSAQKAFERAVQMAGGRDEILLTHDPDVVRLSDRIVLPGVGAFADCRAGILAISGMIEALEEAAITRGRPFLGICVGMQLMATRGLEHRPTQGFAWITGEVQPISPRDPRLKIPHMGWNTIDPTRSHALLRDIPLGEKGLHAYFVHSYQLQVLNRNDVLGETDYGGAVTAIVARDNLVGTQFHPEKSQMLGLSLIANFLRWRP